MSCILDQRHPDADVAGAGCRSTVSVPVGSGVRDQHVPFLPIAAAGDTAGSVCRYRLYPAFSVCPLTAIGIIQSNRDSFFRILLAGLCIQKASLNMEKNIRIAVIIEMKEI